MIENLINSFEIEIFIKLVITVLCGAAIGLEREKQKKPAGLRTHMLVAMGSALLSAISFIGFANSDPTRIAAGIVTGIGFLGAGTIFRSKDHVEGLTTAASLWVAAAVGIAIGAGFLIIGIGSTILTFAILQSKRLEKR